MKMKLIKWGKKSENQIDPRLEAYLDDALQPMAPRPDYVRKLRREILHQYYAVRDEVNAERQRQAILIGASLVGGIFTVVLGIRMLVTMIAAIILIVQWKKPSKLPLLSPERAVK